MPEEGVPLSPPASLMSSDEVVRISGLFVRSLGVRKIRLTGGEPLVRKDFFEIATQLSSLKREGLQTLAVTTNGTALSRRVHQLKLSGKQITCEATGVTKVLAGIDAVNFSLDTLQPMKFEFITKRSGWHLVMASIRSALELGFPHVVKINVVVMRGLNDDEVCDFVQMTQSCPVDVRFIEYMPFDGNKWSNQKIVPFREILARIRQTYPDLEPIYERTNENTLASFSNQTSKPFRVKGFAGSIGFITSMTQNFCSSCNRLRITADGNLKVSSRDYSPLLK